MKGNVITKSYMTLVVLCMFLLCGCTNEKYEYETVEGDMLHTKMYTLSNGLKLFMTENHEQPRIQTYIAVHVGSKHDPAETTGLAHYMEHIAFKGSQHFGTQNYEEEKVLLDQIRDSYEVYRQTTDEGERAAIYRQIDSLSYKASDFFIPNEYDKLMAHIGADGSNAFTSYDQTVYVEDIPSNQIENWAKIQSDRFENLVIRGFHTELEAVYEEFNMYQNSDWDRITTALFGTLTPTHPYNHSVIGLGEHLKNPSIKNIEEFYKTYYVPNNMAICMSGDFDPDYMVETIEKYFGNISPNENLVLPEYEAQPELKEVVEKEVTTPNPEMVVLGWRFDGARSLQSDTLALVSRVLQNGTAGLFDLNLNLSQKCNGSAVETIDLCDYTAMLALGMPLPGQSLEELRQMLLGEVEKLRNGDFSDDLVKGVLTEMTLQYQKQMEENSTRAMQYVSAFVNDIPWEQQAQTIERISKIGKEDLVRFAKEHLCDNNFVCIYKRQGENTDVKPVEKPAITPIQMNRDSISSFAQEIMGTEVAPIEPVFLDFEKDIQKGQTGAGIPVLYTKNNLNNLFTLCYYFDMGNLADKELQIAADYLNYIGTDKLSAQEIAQKFYLLGCEFGVYVQKRHTFIQLSGLSDHMQEAMSLLEDLLANAKPDEDSYKTYVANILKDRQNVVATFDRYSRFLMPFLTYGEEGVHATTLTNEELLATNSEDMTERIHKLSEYQHSVLYYGPLELDAVVASVDAEHKVSETLVACPENKIVPQILPEKNECFLVPYKGTTSFVMAQYANKGTALDVENLGKIRMYNEYFGGGMNTIVFQEMREKRSLCYGAGTKYSLPFYTDEKMSYSTRIQSQNDKLGECVEVFDDIINNMPMSQTAFEISKQGVLTQLRTERVTRDNILFSYLDAKDMGVDFDMRKNTFEQLQNITLKDVEEFQQNNVKGMVYRSAFACDPQSLDKNQLQKLGEPIVLSPEKIFGF